MRLSLWMIHDFLKDLHPTAHITKGEAVLRNVRFFSQSSLFANITAYIGRANQFIDNEENKVICVHHHDFLLFETSDVEEVYNRILDCFDFYNSWYDTCHQKIEDGCTLQELLNEVQYVTREALSVADSNQVVQACHFSPPENLDSLSPAQKQDIQFTEEAFQKRSLPLKNITFVRKYKNAYRLNDRAYLMKVSSDSNDYIVRNLLYNDNVWGYFSESNIFSEPSPGKIQLHDVIGDIITQWIITNTSRESSTNNFSQMLQKLLLEEKDFVSADIQVHLANIGWAANARKQLFLISAVHGEVALQRRDNGRHI